MPTTRHLFQLRFKINRDKYIITKAINYFSIIIIWRNVFTRHQLGVNNSEPTQRQLIATQVVFVDIGDINICYIPWWRSNNALLIDSSTRGRYKIHLADRILRYRAQVNRYCVCHVIFNLPDTELMSMKYAGNFDFLIIVDQYNNSVMYHSLSIHQFPLIEWLLTGLPPTHPLYTYSFQE